MNSWYDRTVDAEFVLRLRKKKGNPSPSITIIRPKRSEESFAVTAITDSSDGTGTVIYFEGWLTI
jgi:hypothetical protein